MALALRCFAFMALALAKPPCLAISDRSFLISSSSPSMVRIIHPTGKITPPARRNILTPFKYGEIIRTLQRAE